jgi:hypothetical protein
MQLNLKCKIKKKNEKAYSKLKHSNKQILLKNYL